MYGNIKKLEHTYTIMSLAIPNAYMQIIQIRSGKILPGRKLFQLCNHVILGGYNFSVECKRKSPGVNDYRGKL